ncbi:hypothetical protein BU251_01745 [Candidatus Velamenicoccus archaeovorus]|uniref:Uncharacterized protein n=1 Tax=Velamenicoccus archaeovorus TaxID=1930593 RepID=A0A410P383_VELA1|nr:hypothetical protein [Candidatus Velamenicoccus archaeovorus]QAT16538.1 hypothetical protein BU251_01745 [Candidatus Velamenicoccus archaeovorus]
MLKDNAFGGYEWRTKAEICGLPLVHIAVGRDQKTGRLLIAKGVIAIGQFAVGIVAVGQFAFGVFAVAQLAVGIACGLGQLAVGMMAMGQVAVGRDIICQIGLGKNMIPAFNPFFLR